MKCFIFLEDEFSQLKWIEKNLYGDGSNLNPDLRRDMANTLNYLLRSVSTIDSDQIGLSNTTPDRKRG